MNDKMIRMMSIFPTMEFVSCFLHIGELPEADAMESSEQLMEFLILLLAVACIAVVIVIAVLLCRSWRLNRQKKPVKDHVYKRKH